MASSITEVVCGVFCYLSLCGGVNTVGKRKKVAPLIPEQMSEL